MWDHYLHEEGLENGDIASDHYHRFEEDIRMMKEGGQNAYRFSLSWPRIIKNKAGEINEKGIAFYHRLLDACHTYGIEPFVTLYHSEAGRMKKFVRPLKPMPEYALTIFMRR